MASSAFSQRSAQHHSQSGVTKWIGLDLFFSLNRRASFTLAVPPRAATRWVATLSLTRTSL